jgi:hypothetical protein
MDVDMTYTSWFLVDGKAARVKGRFMSTKPGCHRLMAAGRGKNGAAEPVDF